MKKWLKLRMNNLRFWYLDIRFRLLSYWRRFIVIPWYRLWIRLDEFDRSLDMDGLAMVTMSDDQRSEYLRDLVRRRDIAHQRDIERE